MKCSYFYTITLHTKKFFIKDFFHKCDQVRRKLRIWSHLLKKYLMENFIFSEVLLLNLKKNRLNFLLKNAVILVKYLRGFKVQQLNSNFLSQPLIML